jgi:hypothetical protein
MYTLKRIYENSGTAKKKSKPEIIEAKNPRENCICDMNKKHASECTQIYHIRQKDFANWNLTQK